jgi:hypothetical protein
MAGFVALGHEKYLGTYKCAEANGIENGTFVVLDHVNQTATLADATTGDGDVYFVQNLIETIDEQFIDDIDFKVAQGKYLRLHKPLPGTVYVTTKFNGTLNQGDIVAVGAGGAVEAIGSRTPQVKFVVKEKTTAYGTDAVKIMVL